MLMIAESTSGSSRIGRRRSEAMPRTTIRMLSTAANTGRLMQKSDRLMGGPKAPGNPAPVRVSTTRQGVIPTNTREFSGAWAWAKE